MISRMLNENLSLFLIVGLIVVLVMLARLPIVKGWFGEILMRLGFFLFLPDGKYRIFHNVTIPDENGGTTQIDHVIVSAFAVFVVETKHYKGWLFGNENDRQWTQKIHSNHSAKFQNPLRQNYKHTECLRNMLELDKDAVKSVVVFTGECTLKTKDKLPAHVTYPGSCTDYIKSFTERRFDESFLESIARTIRENRLTPNWQTSREHKRYVQKLHSADSEHDNGVESGINAESHAEETAATKCPACGAEMVRRTAKRGAHSGEQFWGCTNYPKCRKTVPC